MPYAITAGLDDAASDRIVALWQALATAGISNDALRLGYRPHITLALCPDTTPEAALRDAVGRAASTHSAVPVSLASLGVFPTEPAVVFLAPVVTLSLLALHAATLTALAELPLHPHYRPAAWVPHITLAKDLVAAADGIAVLPAPELPITGRLDRLELVQFRPVRVLATHALPLAAQDGLRSPSGKATSALSPVLPDPTEPAAET